MAETETSCIGSEWYEREEASQQVNKQPQGIVRGLSVAKDSYFSFHSFSQYLVHLPDMSRPADGLVLQLAIKNVQQNLLHFLPGYKETYSEVEPFPLVTQVSLDQKIWHRDVMFNSNFFLWTPFLQF